MAISISSQRLASLNDHLSSIGSQLQHYYVQLTSGKAKGALHFSVYAGQLNQWSASITNLLNDADTLADFSATYPYWTANRLQSVLASLQRINGYLSKHLDCFNHGGAWHIHGARALQLSHEDTATLGSLIGEELSQ